MEQSKKWYQSKIALLGIVIALVGGTDFALGWISGQGVTVEQVQAVQTVYPQVAQGIKDAISSNNIFQALSVIAGSLTTVWRVWFTTAKIK